MKRLLFVIALLASTAFAQVETTPPPPAPPRAIQTPKAAEKTLGNGLRVIVVPKHGVPIAVARLIIKTGAEADPADRAGLADMTASLLTKGTTTRSAKEIAEGIESLGATIGNGASWDNSFVTTSVASANGIEAVGLIADIVMHPTFAESEVKRLRDQNIDALKVSLREPRDLARAAFARVVFGASPYGHTLGGTPESQQAITRDDIVKFHRAHYTPDNAILIFGGDIDADAAFDLAQKTFGAWVAHRLQAVAPSPQPPAEAGAPKSRVVVIDMPQAGQAAVIVGSVGLRRTDPAYPTALVANMVLGGDYSSRLNEEIRIKRGLSYGANSGFDFRRDVGPFTATARTKNESAPEVAALILDELNRLGKEPVGDAEMTARKANLIGTFGRSLETNSGLVSRVGNLALVGLSLSEIEKYVPDIQHVSVADVQSFATAHLGGADANVVIVGNASKFADDLKKRFPNAEVIPVDKLELNKAF
jgi:zinc protease